MKLHIWATRREMGAAAAELAASRLRALADEHEEIPVVFATGASQLETLRALTAIPNIPWERIVGFHMDEYLGISADDPASFRRYMREEIVQRVPICKFYEIDGNTECPEEYCLEYAALLRLHPPLLCLLGIGENGHLAFNDPAEADFQDLKDVKIVSLDEECRRQQVAEGRFASLDDVPPQAVTVTIPALLRIPELILSVPGERKAAIVQRTLQEPISTRCPATILRTHLNATLFLDQQAAGALEQKKRAEEHAAPPPA